MLKQKLIFTISLLTLLIADPPDWEVYPGDFEYAMYLTARVYDENTDMGSENDIVGAFNAGTCVGLAEAAAVPVFLGGGYAFLIQIYWHYNGDEIAFQYYNADEDAVYAVLETILFESDAIIGDVVSPFTLSVLAQNNNNNPPEAESAAYTLDEDNMITVYLSATDEDGDALTFTIFENTYNGTVALSGITATYYPNANYNGTDSFAFIVNDGQNYSNIATINLIVNAVNDAPYLYTVPDAEIHAGETFVYNLQAVDVDGDDLTYTATIISGDGTATLSNNVLNVQGNSNSILEISITVSDGAATDQTSFVLTILEDEPTCTDNNNDGWCDQFPSITISGENILLFNQEQGAEYSDMGAMCSDNEDGDISHVVEVSGQVVNMAIPNIYTIHYNCTDSDGNAAQTLNRTVVVVPPPIADENEDGFDDDAFIAGAQSGDINLDGSLNIVDIVFFIDMILNGE